MENINEAIRRLKAARAEALKELKRIDAALAALGNNAPATPVTRRPGTRDRLLPKVQEFMQRERRSTAVKITKALNEPESSSPTISEILRSNPLYKPVNPEQRRNRVYEYVGTEGPVSVTRSGRAKKEVK